MSSFEGCLCLVGGGNGTHCIAGLAAARGWTVNIFTAFEEEVNLLEPAINEGIQVIHENDDVTIGHVNKVSNNFVDVITEADIVILSLPTLAHVSVLKGMAKFVKDDAVVMAIEGCWWTKPGAVFGEFKSGVSFGLWEIMPWAVRIQEYGRTVKILGASRVPIPMAFHSEPSRYGGSAGLASVLNRMLDVEFDVADSPLSVVMGCICYSIHPVITYGKVLEWDGTPWKESEIPLFYHGISEVVAELVNEVHSEFYSVAEMIRRETTSQLKSVKPEVSYFLKTRYRENIGDDSNTMSCFNTNESYRGISLPCVRSENGKFTPNYNQRYVNADLPFEMIPIMGIGEIFGIPMPTCVKVVEFLQGKIGKEYLAGPAMKLVGKDVCETRAPQSYGITTETELIQRLTTGSVA